MQKLRHKLRHKLRVPPTVFFLLGAAAAFLGDPAFAKEGPSLADYQLLQHKISAVAIRAGVQDASGENDYFFEVHLLAQRAKSEGKKKALEDEGAEDKESKESKESEQSKETKAEKGEEGRDASAGPIVTEIGRFAGLTLKSLAHWTGEGKDPAFTVEVTGEAIRGVMAKAMTELKATEQEIVLEGRITQYEKAKTFWFFGEDLKVGTVRYAIPGDTEPLVIEGDASTRSEFRISYTNAKKGS